MQKSAVKNILFAISVLAAIAVSSLCSAYPVEFTDSSGAAIKIDRRPERVVSLSPSITEAIFTMGAGDAVVGVTHHTTLPCGVAGKQIIGGYFSPSADKIAELKPDVVFLTKMHKKIRKRLEKSAVKIIQMDDTSVADFYNRMQILGAIFDKEFNAAKVITEVKAQLKHVRAKTALIPKSKRKRALRILGRDKIMVPGDDSFHNEFVKAAGGISLKLGKAKGLHEISKKQWMKFNPQVVFYCGNDKEVIDKYFDKPGWKDVDAVKDGRVVGFPCDLTCRTSVNIGYFVAWLSSAMYCDEFAKAKQVIRDGVVSETPLDVKLDYIKDASVQTVNLYDFVNKALIINFKKPMDVISTLEGQRSGVLALGNHFTPPPCWGILHGPGTAPVKKRLCKAAGLDAEKTSLLFTGADMKNLAVKKERFKKMTVFALVTAGVKSNAIRSSQDRGAYYEPGTINIILLTNMKLTKRAMTRAIVTATEAKSAALQDLDIRSAALPQFQATGTGTDNIVVVQGEGAKIDNSGGHTKMGELIAAAVYKGVKEAVYLQNGITGGRNIFQRLKDRNIVMHRLARGMLAKGEDRAFELAGELEKLLLDDRYASFLQAAFSLSDDYEAGLVTNLKLFDKWRHSVSEEIAGVKLEEKQRKSLADDAPEVLKRALDALLTGLYYRKEK